MARKLPYASILALLFVVIAAAGYVSNSFHTQSAIVKEHSEKTVDQHAKQHAVRQRNFCNWIVANFHKRNRQLHDWHTGKYDNQLFNANSSWLQWLAERANYNTRQQPIAVVRSPARAQLVQLARHFN